MTGVIIQARTGSTRFPNKVLKEIGDGKTSIEIICDACQSIKEIDVIVIACPKKDVKTFATLIRSFPNRDKIDIFGGSESNVYQRVLDCARRFNIHTIVDITSDCPFASSYEIKKLLSYVKNGAYYSSNALPERHVPDGLDVQVYEFRALDGSPVSSKSHSGWNISEYAFNEMPFGYYAKYVKCEMPFTDSDKYKDLRITLDTREDLEVLRKIYRSGKWKKLNSKRGYKKFCKWLAKQPSAFWVNKDIIAKIAGEEK